MILTLAFTCRLNKLWDTCLNLRLLIMLVEQSTQCSYSTQYWYVISQMYSIYFIHTHWLVVFVTQIPLFLVECGVILVLILCLLVVVKALCLMSIGLWFNRIVIIEMIGWMGLVGCETRSCLSPKMTLVGQN
jgi:apolipoprotein N-acyltransferase